MKEISHHGHLENITLVLIQAGDINNTARRGSMTNWIRRIKRGKS